LRLLRSLTLGYHVSPLRGLDDKGLTQPWLREMNLLLLIGRFYPGGWILI
jgi:hypothetical protein